MAKFDEVMTIVVVWPSFRVMIGPYILASSARDLWGWSPSLWRFPMIGSGTGPGGRFLGPFVGALSREISAPNNVEVNKKKSKRLKKSMRGTLSGTSCVLHLCLYWQYSGSAKPPCHTRRL